MSESSSTGLLEQRAGRHRDVFRSAETSPDLAPDVYRVPVSAETLLVELGEAPQFGVPTGRQWLRHIVPTSIIQRGVELEARHSFANFRTINLPITTATNVLVLRPAVIPLTSFPITGLSDLLSSTDPEMGATRVIRKHFAEAAGHAAEEWFEDGTESKFSKTLSSLLHAYSGGAIAAVEAFVGSPGINVEVGVEAAKWLGEADHPPTKRYRRTLLEKMLTASSIRLRHGAASGLASMDDPASLDALRGARDREANPRLREFLQLVVDQLERTAACPNL